MLIPKEVIKKEKGFVEQEEWRVEGKYVPFARGVGSASLKVSTVKKKASGKIKV